MGSTVVNTPALRIRRYTQSQTFSDPRLSPVIESRGGQIDPFDGVAKLWWDSVEDLVEAMSTAEGRIAGRALRRDEETFIDLPNSPLFSAPRTSSYRRDVGRWTLSLRHDLLYLYEAVPVENSTSPKGARSPRQRSSVSCASTAANSLRGNIAAS